MSIAPFGLTEMLRPEGAPLDYDDTETDEDGSEKAPGPWSIKDDSAAEWAIRRLEDARRSLADVEHQRREYLAAVERWADQAALPAQHSADYFERLLGDYLLARNAENPELRSIKLPSGEIVSRKIGGGWRVVDEDALFGWLSQVHPELIVLRPHLLKAAANKVIQTTAAGVTDTEGEVVPGVEAIPEARSVSVHTNTKGTLR